MIYVKPSGIEIEVNDNKETIAYVESLGWKKKGAKVEIAEEEIPKPAKKAAKKKAAKKDK